MSTERYPPPSGGGLIEAPDFSPFVFPSMHIRRPRAAASLKQPGKTDSRAAGTQYPPPSGGGLIEAARFFSVHPRGDGISAALGRRPH